MSHAKYQAISQAVTEGDDVQASHLVKQVLDAGLPIGARKPFGGELLLPSPRAARGSPWLGRNPKPNFINTGGLLRSAQGTILACFGLQRSGNFRLSFDGSRPTPKRWPMDQQHQPK